MLGFLIGMELKGWARLAGQKAPSLLVSTPAFLVLTWVLCIERAPRVCTASTLLAELPTYLLGLLRAQGNFTGSGLAMWYVLYCHYVFSLIRILASLGKLCEELE